MNKEEQSLHLRGHQLHRLILKPDGPPRGGMIFLHGHGDYIDRYPDVLAPFLEAGITIILTDTPGHGRSSGKRGAVPDMAFMDQLLEESLTHLPKDLPLGISGHSAGGLLALRIFLRNPERFSFAWFSSPLLEPSQRASPFLRHCLMFLSRYLPWLGWSTGVKSADCRNDPDSQPSSETKALYHSRITLGWAHHLMLAADEIRGRFPGIPADTPILFTQGSDDPICPVEFLHERLQKLPKSQVSYREIKEALHEPFTGDTAETFQKELKQWVYSSLSPMD